MISVNNLKFSYKKGQELFESLSLEFSAGHIYGLLGKNGEGKSTLLKLISGVLFLMSGEIECLGATPSDREPSFLSQIYYIPEEVYSPNCSIEGYAGAMSRLYPNFNREEFDGYIEEFQLDPKRKITAMSLGQKKKFAIAFGLACNSRLLIMDEPTNGLDIPSKSQFRKIVSRVATDDRTIIISTHQVRDLDNLIDHITILEQGQIVLNCSVDTISQRLSFRDLHEGDKPLYEEGNSMSRRGIVESEVGEYSKVDIEMLFNAVVANAGNITTVLDKNFLSKTPLNQVSSIGLGKI